MIARKITLLMMSLSMLAIAGTAIYYHADLGAFVQDKEIAMTQTMPPEGMGSGMENSSAMNEMMNMSAMFGKDVDPEFSKKAGELMQKMQAEPNNADTLLDLSLLFFEVEDYVAMLNFSSRANTIDPMNARAAYLSAIAHSQLGEVDEAIAAFERSLAIDANPSTLYSLAILYKYNKDNAAKSSELLQKALEIPNLDANLKANIEKELAGN